MKTVKVTIKAALNSGYNDPVLNALSHLINFTLNNKKPATYTGRYKNSFGRISLVAFIYEVNKAKGLTKPFKPFSLDKNLETYGETDTMKYKIIHYANCMEVATKTK